MELLSESGRKTKRNLLFFALVSWALALGYITPQAGDSAVAIYGLGLNTTMGFVLAVLAVLQVYNLLAFAVYTFQSLTNAKAADSKGGMFVRVTLTGLKFGEGLDQTLVNRAWVNKYLAGLWDVWIPPAVGVAGLVGTALAYGQL